MPPTVMVPRAGATKALAAGRFVIVLPLPGGGACMPADPGDSPVVAVPAASHSEGPPGAPMPNLADPARFPMVAAETTDDDEILLVGSLVSMW